MSLEETKQIDMIIQNHRIGGYDLVVVDKGEVTDQSLRYQRLLEKLRFYADTVLSGKLALNYPDSKGRPIRFCVEGWIPPTNEMRTINEVLSQTDPAISFPVVFLTRGEHQKEIMEANAKRIGKPYQSFD